MELEALRAPQRDVVCGGQRLTELVQLRAEAFARFLGGFLLEVCLKAVRACVDVIVEIVSSDAAATTRE